MHGELASKALAIEDLGPLIGARPGAIAQAKGAPAEAAHVLPDLPFNTERWDSVDADVVLRAASIRRAKEVPMKPAPPVMNTRFPFSATAPGV